MFIWINFLVYAIVTSITPGPNNIMSMSNGKYLGVKNSISFNFGVGIGVFIILIVCAALGSSISAFLPSIKTPMTILGSLYILYLAFKTFTSKGIIKENFRKTNLLIGAALQFINPKAYIYSIVSMEIYILPYFQNDIVSIIFLALCLTSISVLATLCWTIFGSIFEKIFSKYAKITNTIMAMLLVYCAVSLYL